MANAATTAGGGSAAGGGMAFPILPVIGLGIQLLSSLLGGGAQAEATEKENQREDYYNANMGQNINQYMKNYLLAPIGDPSMPYLGDPASLGMAPAQAQGAATGGAKPGGKPQVPGNPAGGGGMVQNPQLAPGAGGTAPNIEAMLPAIAQLMMGGQAGAQGGGVPGGALGQGSPAMQPQADPTLQLLMGLMGGGASGMAPGMAAQQQPVNPILQYMMGGGR